MIAPAIPPIAALIGATALAMRWADRLTDQRPAGGCVNCGAPVRTRKGGYWLCSRCWKAGIR